MKHALRSLVKSGHRGALAGFGAGDAPAIRVGDARVVPKRVHIGKVIRFSFEIASTANHRQELLVDYAVHFVKADRKTRAKVFKLRTIVLQPHASTRLESTISFEHLTTRRPYPGLHKIDVLVNGVAHSLVEFDVRR